MPLAQVDLQVDQDADWSNSFVFATADTGPLGILANAVYYNLTGFAMQLQVRETDSAASQQLLALAIGSGLTLYTGTLPGGIPAAPASPNGVTVAVTAAQSSSMPAGAWAYDLAAINGAGIRTYLLKGSFTVRPTVTR